MTGLGAGLPEDMTLGELARRVDRIDSEVRDGFAGVREEIRSLAFVHPAVYAADRQADGQRFARIERDLTEEKNAREDAERMAAARAWQARFSLVMALLGLPISVIGSVVVALVVAQIK